MLAYPVYHAIYVKNSPYCIVCTEELKVASLLCTNLVQLAVQCREIVTQTAQQESAYHLIVAVWIGSISATMVCTLHKVSFQRDLVSICLSGNLASVIDRNKRIIDTVNQQDRNRKLRHDFSGPCFPTAEASIGASNISKTEAQAKINFAGGNHGPGQRWDKRTQET